MIIKKASAQDAATIVQFNVAMALETEGKTLVAQRIEQGVTNLLNSPARGFYVVAQIGDQTVGSLMITTEWSDWRNGDFWWVQSVYVKPQFRQQGVYRAMYEWVQALASADPNVCGFRLYVEQENINAQKTYRSLGMEKTHYLMFETMKKGVKFFE